MYKHNLCMCMCLYPPFPSFYLSIIYLFFQVVRLDKHQKKYEAKKIEREEAWKAFMLAKSLRDTLQKDPAFMWSDHVMSKVEKEE